MDYWLRDTFKKFYDSEVIHGKGGYILVPIRLIKKGWRLLWTRLKSK